MTQVCRSMIGGSCALQSFHPSCSSPADSSISSDAKAICYISTFIVFVQYEVCCLHHWRLDLLSTIRQRPKTSSRRHQYNFQWRCDGPCSAQSDWGVRILGDSVCARPLIGDLPFAAPRTYYSSKAFAASAYVRWFRSILVTT